MSADGIIIETAQFNDAMARALAQSKREPVVFMKEQARGVVKKIIGVTPPASITPAATDYDGNQSWSVIQGGAAKRYGQATVSSDIRKLYGTRADAVRLMKNHATHAGMVKGFVKSVSSGELSRAKELFRYVTGKGIAPFDGGALHRQQRLNAIRSHRGGVGRIKNVFYYITNDDALKQYIKEMQARVGFLASGWNQACAILGVRPPVWIWRQNGPGTASVEVDERGITIKMINNVGYASEMDDWERRIQYALDSQVAAINRRSERFLKTIFNSPDFKLSGFKEAA
jgi:hypothetical protein